MTTDENSTTRRRIIRAGVAAGAGVGAAAVVASPASAAPGDPVILGQVNDAGAAETVLVGGSSANPTLTVQGTSPKLVLAPTPEANIPQQLPTGSLAVTPVADLVIGGRGGTRAYVNTTRWANRTMAVPPQRIMDTRYLSTYSGNLLHGAANVESGKLKAKTFMHLTLKNVSPVAGEKAVSAYINITVAGTVAGGFLAAYSSGLNTIPETSSLNWWGPNQILSNLVEVQLGSYNGNPFSFAIYVNSPASVIVDVSGLTLAAPGRY